MKPVAIVAALWPRHLGALDTFLSRYGPTTLLVADKYATPFLQGVADSHGCPIVVIESLLPGRYNRRKRVGPMLAALRALVDSAQWQPDDLGGPGVDRLRPVVERAATAELPAAVQLLDSLDAARSRFEITLFVTSEDVTPIGRLAAAWASEHDVPSLHIAHSIALADPYTVHARLTTDVLAVYGERGAEGYLDLGIEPERIVVTGNPGWDEYAALAGRRLELRARLDERYGLDPALPLVVFGTTSSGHQTALEPRADPNPASLAAFVAACEELAAQGFPVNAVVKDRPSNKRTGEAAWEAVLSSTSATQRYVRTSEDTQSFAAAADVLVAVDSNYLVEAMLMGTPAVNLVSESLTVLGPTFEEETGVVEAEPDQLAAALRRLVTDDDFRAARLAQTADRIGYYHHGGADGQAGRRVGELMVRLALPRPGPVTVLADRAVRAVKRLLRPVVRRIRRPAASRGRTT
jgi:hypothetical protein